jgi:hypothetical protein
MMITLEKDDITAAIRCWLSDYAGVPTRNNVNMTWYIDSLNEPWRLEVNEVKEQEA